MQKSPMGGPKNPYAPPPEFQEADVETLVKEALSDTTELWLIQMPLNQLQPADFMGKQLSLKMSKGDGLLGRLRNSHDKSFDMVGMGSQGVEPFAFIPRPSASMGVRRIARHVRLQCSSEENVDSLGQANSSAGFSGSKDRATVNGAVQSLVQESITHNQGASVGSVGHKSSQVVSGMSYEGGERSTLSGKRSRKERQTNGTPTASYAKNLEESGAYNSSEPQGQSFVTPKVKEEHSTGGKKKLKKHGSGV